MNTSRTTWGTARITAVGLTVLLLATCSGGVTGIFYTLATQTSRADRNLPNNVAFNVVHAGDRFYVAAASIWTRPVDGDKWGQVNNPPADGGVVTVLSLAYHQDHLYAGFLFDRAGKDSFGLYRAKPGGTLSWAEVTGIGDKQVVRLLVAGPTLLAITNDGDAWGLHRLDRGDATDDTDDAFKPIDVPDLAGPIRDVAYHDTPSPAFWVTTKDAVYHGDTLDALSALDDGPSGSDFVGVVSASGYVYVSDRTGNVHWQFDKDKWQVENIHKDSKMKKEDMPLAEFAVIGDKILAGTESLGFYSFKAGDDGSPTEVTRHPHFTNEALYNAHVQRFAYLPSGKPEHLFAITFTDGLFSTTADNLDNWNQE